MDILYENCTGVPKLLMSPLRYTLTDTINVSDNPEMFFFIISSPCLWQGELLPSLGIRRPSSVIR
jgi:hypothetical protein